MHTRSILAVAAATLTSRFLLAADVGGGTGTQPPKTLEQRLTDAVSEADTLRTQATSLTAERDTAKSSLATLQSQFDELSKTATETKTKLTTAESDLATAKQTIRTTQAALETENKSVSRLETLCGVKGLDPNAAPPTSQQPDKKTVAQWDAEMKSAANDPVAQSKVAKAYQAALAAGQVL